MIFVFLCLTQYDNLQGHSCYCKWHYLFFLWLPNTLLWRRKWQPTPVFLPGESHGRRSLVGCSPWGRTESDTTDATQQQQQQQQYSCVCVCVCIPPPLYPFTCQRTFRLLLCLNYCKKSCCEHCAYPCILQVRIRTITFINRAIYVIQ